MLLTKDWEIVKQAKKYAEKQLEWYTKMMNSKNEATAKRTTSEPWPFPKSTDYTQK